jgi:hypothetical protein
VRAQKGKTLSARERKHAQARLEAALNKTFKEAAKECIASRQSR